MRSKTGLMILAAAFVLVLSYISPNPASAAEQPVLSWDYVMSRPWQRPQKLDDFVGVHPRYLLNEARITTLKSRIKTTHKKLWEIVEQKADSFNGRQPALGENTQSSMRRVGRELPWMALAYVLTENPVHLDNAKKWMMALCECADWDGGESLGAGECLSAVAIGYDWLYHKLSESERNYIKERLVHHAELMKNGPPQHHDRWLANHNHVENSGLAAAGFVLYDEVPQAIDWLRQTGLSFKQTFEIISPDGSSDEGHQYWAYSTESLLCYAVAARDLLGMNYFDNDFMKNAPYFIIFSNLPRMESGNYVMTYGDSSRGYDARNPAYILYRLASEFNNGFAQDIACKMTEQGIGADDYKTWCSLIWYDPDVKPVSISELPTFKHFENIGWITTRSGWDEDAVMIGFKCSPFHGHKLQPYYEKMTDLGWEFQELAGGHCHPDIDSFQIYAYGKWLAIDPGYERPKYTRTHNTILVNGAGQLGESAGAGKGYLYFDRKTVAQAKAKSTIIRADSRADYDYIIGDAGNIYPASTGLKKFYRHLLYIKPDIILVVDELQADRPCRFEWRLHTEQGIDKVSGNYFIAKNQDVVMDTHIVRPEPVETLIEGKYLRVLSGETDRTIIATVLHPRRINEPASEVQAASADRSVISLNILCGQKKVNVKLDFASQKVSLQ